MFSNHGPSAVTVNLPFRDRVEAGRLLGEALCGYAGRSDVVVLALPRGGVPVAFEVVKAIDAPLDLMLVRKLGTHGQEELAMGAIASGGVRLLNPDIVAQLRISGLNRSDLIQVKRAAPVRVSSRSAVLRDHP